MPFGVHAYGGCEKLDEFYVYLVVGVVHGNFGHIAATHFYLHVCSLKFRRLDVRIALGVQTTKFLTVDDDNGFAGHTVAKEGVVMLGICFVYSLLPTACHRAKVIIGFGRGGRLGSDIPSNGIQS